MSAYQMPIDGREGKDWKVTSFMGNRKSPMGGKPEFHPGTDIVSGHEPCWIEAPASSKVLDCGKTSVLGNFVVLRHTINGQRYVTRYLHMQDGSIKVKKGQGIAVGTPIGKMGTTGMSTGKHLHWELRKGGSYVYDASGKGYIEPVAFFKSLIAHETVVATAPVPTAQVAPVTATPAHSIPAPAVAPATPPKAPASPTRPTLKMGSKGAAVKYLQGKLKVASDGDFGPMTDKAVKEFQKAHKLTADGIVGEQTWKVIG